MRKTSSDSRSADRPGLEGWLARGGVPPAGALARLLAGPRGERPPRPAAPRPEDRLRVLMLLCQKTGSTGSGIVVKEMVDRAVDIETDYHLICGGEPGDRPAALFDRPPSGLDVVRAFTPAPDGLPFAMPGMSNQMPYESQAFKDLSAEALTTYLDVWTGHVRRAVAAFRPHLIHVHHLWLLAAVAAAEAPHCPLVASIHGTDLFRAGDAPHLAELVRAWAGRVDGVLGLTAESVAVARSLYPIPLERCEVFGNGFNETLFQPGRSATTDALAQYGLAPSDHPVVLTVAKYDPRKGVEWLLRGFALLPEHHRDVALVVAGSGPEEEARRYRELAGALGIGDRVTFTGAVRYEDVAGLMNRASVFALPAYREPFGLVVLEALACGCRVVTTDQAGPAEFVPPSLRQDRDAILVRGLGSSTPPPGEGARFARDLAAAMSEQLARPLSAGQRASIAGAVAPLTWGAYVSRLGRFYRGLVGDE